MIDLDDTDRRILRALQENGRMTNAELAKRSHLSTTACFERVRRLRDRGVILGYTALIEPAAVGRGLLIFIEVVLDRTAGDLFDAFASEARRRPEILECHMVAGGFDYLIKARLADMEAYREFLGAVLVQMPGVRETRTYAVMEEIKSTTVLPI
jgi:Lrp/AsnC family leucine-responsive transcriptional regulator